MRPVTRTWPEVLVTLAFVGAGTTALSHGVPYPKRDHLFLSPGRAKLAIVYVIDDEGEERALRDRFDRDGDGTLDRIEARAASALLVGLARRGTTLRLDGTPLPLRVTAHTVYGLGSDLRPGEHLAVDVVLEATLPVTGSFRLEVDDAGRSGRPKVPLVVSVVGHDVTSYASGRISRSPRRSATHKVEVAGVALEAAAGWWIEVAVPGHP